jgi:hypothetical protein
MFRGFLLKSVYTATCYDSLTQSLVVSVMNEYSLINVPSDISKFLIED